MELTNNQLIKMTLNLLRRNQRDKFVFPLLLKLLGIKIITNNQLLTNQEGYVNLTYALKEYVSPQPPNNIGEIPESIKVTSLPFSINRPIVSEIENAQLIGDIAVGFDKEGNIIAETTQPPLGDLSPRFDGSISVESLFLKKIPLAKRYHLGSACSLVNFRSKSYYHWFLDCLTRLEGLEYYQKYTGDKPLLIIDSNPTSWQIESLKFLGYEPGTYVYWDKSKKIHLKKLIVPTFRQPGNWISPSALHWLRGQILKTIQNQNANKNQYSFSPRIYISRSKASGRRVINEEKLIELLHQFGFVRYTLEDMSLWEQIQLFSSAEIVIAPHGAGLTNIIFSQKPITVIEFVNPWVSPHYYLISTILGFTYWCFECHQPYLQKLRKGKGDMIVDVESLHHLLKQLIT